jgi:DNA-binding MarR family transcriptional regulator
MIRPIIELLESWEKFQQEQGGGKEAFARWLLLEEEKTDGRNEQDGEIGFLLGTIMGYAEHWSKLGFQDLPIRGFMEFGILKFIEMSGHPSKKTVAEKSLAENSTVFECLKRLIRQELIMEYADNQDRRVKRVCLTRQGEEITTRATEKAQQLSSLLVGDLTREEKAGLTAILNRLNTFHQHLYQEKSNEEVMENYLR